jgi:hypothetical protein
MAAARAFKYVQDQSSLALSWEAIILAALKVGKGICEDALNAGLLYLCGRHRRLHSADGL